MHRHGDQSRSLQSDIRRRRQPNSDLRVQGGFGSAIDSRQGKDSKENLSRSVQQRERVPRKGSVWAKSVFLHHKSHNVA